MNPQIFNQIVKKKEFSKIPRKDIELAFLHFEKRQCSDEEKIRLTRDLLRKVFSAFTSKKLLSLKNKSPEWILRKHLSTRERLPYYKEIYERIFKNFNNEKEISIIDLGAGVNGFSYNYLIDALKIVENSPRHRLPDQLATSHEQLINEYSLYHKVARPPLRKKINDKSSLFPTSFINYLAIESIGQLVDLMNFYFKQKKIKNANAIHLSLFELEKVKEIIKKTKKPKVVFLFKVVDSLEMLERDYSKKLLNEIVPLADKIVVSFAMRSMIKRRKFFAKRNWIVDFVEDKFCVLDDFEIGSERYIVFQGVFV